MNDDLDGLSEKGLIGIIACLFLILPLVAVLGYGCSKAHGQSQTVIRDASGRTTGTATTDSQGTTVFRDVSGRTIGTASPNGTTGTTTFRDDRGRTTGTVSRPPR